MILIERDVEHASEIPLEDLIDESIMYCDSSLDMICLLEILMSICAYSLSNSVAMVLGGKARKKSNHQIDQVIFLLFLDTCCVIQSSNMKRCTW